MANSILVEPMESANKDGSDKEKKPLTREEKLVMWVMSRVNRWREYRDSSFKDKWDEYYRLWRGRWHVKDKNRKSERSKIVTPALSQAIDMTAAELEMAVFSNAHWFDVEDNYDDNVSKENRDVMMSRDHLREDTDFVNVQDAVSECFLNGAIYGTLIAKIVLYDDRIHTFKRNQKGELIPVKQGRVFFGVEPIDINDFIPDPAGRNIDEMLGAAHELIRPRAAVQRLMNSGTYVKKELQPYNVDNDIGLTRGDLEQSLHGEDVVLITEYHGLVPAKLLPTQADKLGEKNPLDSVIDSEIDKKDGDGPLVEAIVTIANKSELLRGIKNPFPGGDRSIITSQHEKVPGRFYGRGVAEKGYNPQKALDAEIRMRIDALALISNPMMGADVTRLPRGFDFTTRPGKVWLTQGAPKDVLHPVEFSQLNPQTFNQSSELERMVQSGTGAFEVAAPLKENRRNETASGSSMIMGAFVKRSKLVLHNIERNFLSPLLRKLMWRYMKFEPKRYPADATFKVISTMGIVARELEQGQLIQLAGLVPPESPPFMTLLKAVASNMSLSNKTEIMASIDKMMNPSKEEIAKQKRMEQLKMLGIQLELAEKESKARQQIADEGKKKAEAILAMAKAMTEQNKAELERAGIEIDFQKLMIELREVMAFEEQNEISRISAITDRIKALNETKDEGEKE